MVGVVGSNPIAPTTLWRDAKVGFGTACGFESASFL